MFTDILKVLGDEEVPISKVEQSKVNVLRTFTDLQYSRNRKISCIQWPPKTNFSVAVSCKRNVSFETLVEDSGEAKNSYTLMWSFHDLIHPQFVLESPYEVSVFKFNPDNPNIIAAGTDGGMVLLWDISGVAGQGKGGKAGDDADGGDDEEETKSKMSIIKPLQMVCP